MSRKLESSHLSYNEKIFRCIIVAKQRRKDDEMKESPSLEFKREPSKTFLKTVSAFANYGTGKVVFGVDDNGEVVGLADPGDAALRVENAINDALVPVPRFAIAVDESSRTVELTVFEGVDKPYLYGGKAYRRADAATVAVDRLEYNRLSLLGANTTFDALGSVKQDLSFELLEGDLREKAGIQALDRNALISLELADSEGRYCNAAALLADDNQFEGIDMARFGGDLNTIHTRRSFDKSSLLLQMRQAMEMFEEYYGFEKIVGAERVVGYLVPREAFREAIANALVHRCWDVRANIKVSMFADRIEIASPGGLPQGITEEEYLSGGPSVSRNPILANVFFRLGYIERFGTGIPRIIQEYAGLTASPRFDVRGASITVVLPVDGSVGVSSDEAVILKALPKGASLTRAEISDAAGMSRDKTIRVLGSLVDKGLVIRSGSSRSTRYSRN